MWSPAAPGADRHGTNAAAASNTGLRPDHVATEGGTGTLTPLYLQAQFLAIPSLLTLAIAGGWFGLRRRATDPNGARRGRQRRPSRDSILQNLESAARAGDAASFFNLARTALETVDGADSDHGDDIRRFLALADEANYAGLQPTQAEFARWLQLLRDALQPDPRARGTTS